MKANLYVGTALTALVMAAFGSPGVALAADGPSLLTGKVLSTTGEPLAGIPIKAHRDSSPVTVAVYTDQKGEYSFPSWSDLTPGGYSIAVELPDFERTAPQHVAVAEGKPATVDFALKSKPLAYEDATASEIIAGLPGTDEQKVLFSQCSNCHTLQWALYLKRTKEDWIRVIKKMAGRAAERATPGTYAFSQAPMVEPLADYLVSIRGPDSPDLVPFQQRPRPTNPESTNIVVTEYALPRGGQRELYMLRGDRRFVWPHDVIMNDKYAYYTDHFSYMIGRVDVKTGETKELPFTLPAGAGREARAAGGEDGRPGDPGGGAHELQFDQHGNVIVGMENGTVKYDPKYEKFTGGWSTGRAMYGLDPQGNVWFQDRRNGQLVKLDTNDPSVKPTSYVIPKNQGIYDTDTDSKSRTDLYIWTEGKVGIFDPRTVEYAEYKTPTPMAGPRRGQIDGQDRLWAAEFYAGQVLMFDPDKKILKEYPLVNGTKPYTAPYTEPYSASADDKNQLVWTHDFSSDRLYKIDMNTGKSVEYMTPSNYEVRDLKVDPNAERPTVWVPAYRPPSKLVKIVVR
ncbi:MAG: carboxypeptidase regulatory-like domain-containing protein [Acetobacteraceae bacterium]|nr:carboxypeptidase regulatory-like domain-containing protein [Acetobacteraceae bacterium]